MGSSDLGVVTSSDGSAERGESGAGDSCSCSCEAPGPLDEHVDRLVPAVAEVIGVEAGQDLCAE